VIVIDARVSIIIVVAELLKIAVDKINWRDIFKKATEKTLKSSTVDADEFAKRLEETHIAHGEGHRAAANRVFTDLVKNGKLPEDEFWQEIELQVERQLEKPEKHSNYVGKGVMNLINQGSGNAYGYVEKIDYHKKSPTL